jgi:hypothetical protein
MQGRTAVSPARASYLFAGLDHELFLRGAARKRSSLQCSIREKKEKIQRIKSSHPTVGDPGDRGIKSPEGRPARPFF